MNNLSYDIYPDQRLVIYRVEGVTTLKSMMSFFDENTSDPRYDGSYDGIGDWREVETSFTREETMQLAKYVLDRSFSTATWVALVSTPRLTAYAEIYANVVKPIQEMHVCSTVERAAELLKRDRSELPIA